MSIKDEMTSLERIVAAITYQKPDRVPVAPLFSGAAHRITGVPFDKWSMDAEMIAQSFLHSQEIIGFDCFVTLIDLSLEAYDYGQKVIFPKNSTAYADTSDPMIKNVDDYYKIKRIDPTQTPRMKMLIDTTRMLSKAKGKEVGIVGFVYGPLGVLSQMRGHERLFKDCLKNPDAVLHAQDVITDTLIDFALAQIEAGAHAICIDTLYASGSIMSKKLWEKMEAEHCKKFADAIHKAGVPLIPHNCGNDIYFDVHEKWMNPTAISHAYPADDCKDWAEHAEKWGKKIVTIGYMTPSMAGLMMTPEEVMEECRREFEIFKDCNGGFILAPGCEFPPNGHLLNAMAMVQGSKAYCRY